jgi:hypothetical protein
MVLDKAVGEGIGSDRARGRDRENIEPVKKSYEIRG